MVYCKAIPMNHNTEIIMKQHTLGWLNGLVGVAIFSGSLPATRVAVQELSPLFVTSARACLAALLGGLLLWLLKQHRPQAAHMPALLLVSVGVVLGFPLLTAWALQYASSAHAIVFVGLLPLCTALFAVWCGAVVRGHRGCFGCLPYWARAAWLLTPSSTAMARLGTAMR